VDPRHALREEFPRWSIVHSDAGRWWGFHPPAGGNPDRIDLDADTPDDLRTKILAKQREIEE
jgi:hypothetical protein